MTKTSTRSTDLQRAAIASQGAPPAHAPPRIIPAGRPLPRRSGSSWRPLYIGVIGA